MRINDPLIVDLPKGRFRLVYERRKVPPEPLQVSPIPPALPPPEAESSLRGAIERSYTRWWAIAATVALSLAIGFGLRGLTAKSTVVASPMPLTQWTPEIDMLWGSFVKSKRPLLVLIEDPLFVELHSNPGVYYRDRSLNQWSEIEHSQTMQSLSTTLKSSGMQPSHYYTAFGEVQAAFQLRAFAWPLATAVFL